MQQILKGILTGTDVDSAGRRFAIVQPLDGTKLSGFVYGVPNARKGGPEVGSTVELLVIPGNLGRNFTYVSHKAVDTAEMWAKAKPAETGTRTQTAPKELSAEERKARAEKRNAYRAAAAAADAQSEPVAF